MNGDESVLNELADLKAQVAALQTKPHVGGGKPVIWFTVNGVGDMGAFYVPSNRTIKAVTLLGHGGVAGSVTVDLRKETYTNYSTTQPDSADSICGASKPAIASAYKSRDATLSGWTPGLTTGDVLLCYCELFSIFSHVDVLVEIE